MKRLWTGLAVFGAIAVVVTAGTPVQAAPATIDAALPVLGYAENGTSTSAVNASAPALATLGVDGININSSGTNTPMPDSSSVNLLHQAHAKNLRGEILIGNYSDALGDFDSNATHLLVSSSANINRVVSTLVNAVNSQGWDGVHVDLEAIRAQDTAGLVTFVTALKNALPAGKTASLAITAFTSAQAYLNNGYDLTRLGTVLDRIALMGYDQHGPTWNGTGPIGGLPWQEQALQLVLAKVPAAKVDLGVAGYGYTFLPGGGGDQVSDSRARQIVQSDGSTARFDTTQGEWTVTLRNGTVMWWSDSRSWPLRITLANKYHLHGMALWSLGLSDPVTAH